MLPEETPLEPGTPVPPPPAQKLRDTYLRHEEGSAAAVTSEEQPTAAEEASAPERSTAELEERLQQLQQQYEELHDRYLRLAADFDNYRKRVLQERERWMELASENLLRGLLPILDDLHGAVEAARSTQNAEALRQGLELIYANALKLFQRYGVVPMESPVGKPFDVRYHEAVAQLPSALPEGHVVQELQRGYLLHNRVLRHAKVATSSGAPEDSSPTNTAQQASE
jgi:molecular chaperone GrpE